MESQGSPLPWDKMRRERRGSTIAIVCHGSRRTNTLKTTGHGNDHGPAFASRRTRLLQPNNKLLHLLLQISTASLPVSKIDKIMPPFSLSTLTKTKKFVRQFFSFPGRVGTPPLPARGSGWGPSIGLKGGGSGGRPRPPKTEVNNNFGSRGNPISTLTVAPRPSSVQPPPPHLTESIAYIKRYINQHPTLVDVLRNNNLEFLYPYQGRLYRLQYSQHVTQITPISSQPSLASNPNPSNPLATNFQQVRQHALPKTAGNNPAHQEVVDLVTPPRRTVVDLVTPPRRPAGVDSSPTITLS